MDSANSVAAAPGRGLNKERKAQAFGVAQGVVERFHGSATPRRHWYSCLLGQKLRRDLVAQPPHHVTVGADEHKAKLAAKVREGSVLSHEAPSYPDRIRACGCQRPFDPAIVHITALGLLCVWIEDLRGAQTHSFIRLTNKHGVTVGFGEKRDGAQRCAVLLVELAGRVDETHGGFRAIDDSHALKFMLHKGSDQQIATLIELRLSRSHHSFACHQRL
jgi:hypothetical protein